jgi:predicted secreted hydrolase
LVDVEKDLAWHGGEHGNESWFLIANLKSGEDRIGIQVHFLIMDTGEHEPMISLNVGLTNESTKWYKPFESVIPMENVTLAKDRLMIKAPGFSMVGDLNGFEIKAEFGGSAIDMVTKNQNPTLINKAQGLVYFLGSPQYEYAFTAMQSSGTVTMDGERKAVEGISWFDRQWGGLPEFFSKGEDANFDSMQWAWFCPQLDNGMAFSITQLWEFETNTLELISTATLPDGTHIVSTIDPIEMSDYWTSPATGKRFPTHFVITIPGLDAKLDIDVPFKEQEIVSDLGSIIKFEGMMNVSGTVQGESINGEGYVEMVGRWK